MEIKTKYVKKINEEKQNTLYDFENFCMDFGYSTDSIKAFNIYTECQKQQKELFELIPEEKIREQIREII